MKDLTVKPELLLTDKQLKELLPLAIKQLNKDAQLAGIEARVETAPLNMEEFIKSVVSFIKMAKNKNPNWENLTIA